MVQLLKSYGQTVHRTFFYLADIGATKHYLIKFKFEVCCLLVKAETFYTMNITKTKVGKILALGFLVLSSFVVQSAPYFEFTPKAKIAYQQALSLRFDAAKTTLAEERRANPDNLIADFVENYIDFFTIFINEDEDEFNKLEPNKERRLERIRKGPKDSPFYLYTQAEIQLQWAISRLKFEENFTALREIRKAYKLLESNAEQFPDFVVTKKSLGVLHAMVGTVPDSYKWAVKMVGLSGTIEQGIDEIKEVIYYGRKNDFIFEEETLVMYSLLMLHIGNQSEEAWELINNAKLECKTNPLACFVLASVAIHTGRNEEAIQILENRPTSPAYHPFHYLDYMTGLSKLYTLEPDADIYLKRYTENFKGQNYIKEAYQKLAWHSLLTNNGAEYDHYMSKCKSKGNTVIDGDKKALKEAQYGPRPNKLLLEARMLCDGGYYTRAEKLLVGKSPRDFETPYNQLEFSYRRGRVYHKLGKHEKAITDYQNTIDNGQFEPYYFACNAALQAGLVYESLGDIEKTRSYFQTCLQIKPDEYRNSLHQKAKAGLNRIKGK